MKQKLLNKQKSQTKACFLENSEIKTLLTNCTRSFNYPNLSKLPKDFQEKTCIVCDVPERSFVLSQSNRNVFIASIDDFDHNDFAQIIESRNVEKILIVSINHGLEYKESINKFVINNNISIPIYDWFSEVIVNLSIQTTIDIKEPKLLAILCTSRSGSQMLCDLMSQAKEFGNPKEHLTMPIVLPAEKNIINMNEWFSKLIFVHRNTNVCSTKLTAYRINRLVNSIQKDEVISYLKKFKFIVLKRKNIFAQSVSLYFALMSDQWHRRKMQNILDKDNYIEYNYKKIRKIYYDFKQQEKNIDEILEKVAVPSSNQISIYYEDLVADKQDFLKNLADFMDVDYQDSWLDIKSNLTRFDSENKIEMTKRFRQEFMIKG